MILTDTFLEMGSQHKVCEDYIIKGNYPTPYIILADGCSSSNNSEMGARILCHLAKQYLKYRKDDLHELDQRKTGNWIIHNAEMTARQLGLSTSCLDATLIIAFQLENRIQIFMYGDGVIIRKIRDLTEVTTIDFAPANAPFYLSYLVDQERFDCYHDMKNELVKTIFHNGELKSSETFAYDAQIFFKGNAFDTLFICSDGISSFISGDRTERKLISHMEILPNLMSFKNTKGEFLKRRAGKELKTLSKSGIHHYDDLSIGAFHYED